MPRKKQEDKNRRNNKKETRERRIRPPAVCLFCKEGKEPGYKDFEILYRFITDRGRIIARERSGVCAKHQRRLARAIKQARYLALLPYVVRPEW